MLYATIMAGGAGTRFWPASRRNHPKQLLNLVGARSMVQATVDRLEGFVPNANLLIVTNQALVEPISAQLPEIPRSSIIGEPAKRDTAPCVALAATLIAARDPEATMIVMPADHVISPVDQFQSAMRQAVELVEADSSRLVTLGIPPAFPSEAFGYIERHPEPLPGVAFPTYPVVRFREKPDRETAAKFVAAGNFYWNSGIFVWKARTILDALKEYEPSMFIHLQQIAESVDSLGFSEVLNREFTAIQGKSIDYAVMERYPNVLMIEAPFDWDDLGSWSAVPRLQGSDAQGNTIQAKHMGINTAHSIIRAEDGHLVVTLGVQNLIVVHTSNATLIAHRDDEAAIKDVVARLEQNQWHEFL
jgi:mannose-1-phosphate guanylyltransferase